MADGLIPDLAPNLYSQGQVGTGYAQVFDLGAPNPFAVTQDYINQTVANKKEAVKAAVANEEKRQQKLDEFLASIDDIDQPWNMAKVEIGNAIDDYGNKIAEMRAQGTAINSSLLMKEQKKLKDLAKINESNYQKAMKIGTAMQDPLIYTDDEREQFQQSIKDAGNPDKNGSVQKVQEVLDQWQKSVETPNVVEDYKKVKPVAKDETGYTKKTTEDDFNKAVKAQLTSYQKPQLKKLLKMYQDENRISKYFTSEDIDSNQQAVLNAIENEMKVDLESQKEFDVTPKTYSGSGSVNKVEKMKVEPFKNYETSSGDESLAISNASQRVFNLRDVNGASIGLTPSSVTMVSNYKNYPDGYYIVGQKTARKSDKTYLTKEEASESGELTADSEIQETPERKFVIVESQEELIPLTDENNAKFKASSGIDLIANYKKLLGSNYKNPFEGGKKTSSNTQTSAIPVANPQVLDQDPN
jgi:uncharacterized protein YeaO (DUF488 family)